MVKYVLFGQQVIFDNPAERNFDLQYACWTAVQDAQTMFSSWYDNCKRIERVINDYKSIAGKMIGDLAYEPLYKTLIQYDIYDVSKDTYWRQCADFSETEEALQAFCQRLVHVVRQIVQSPDMPLARVSICPPDEAGRMEEWSLGRSLASPWP